MERTTKKYIDCNEYRIKEGLTQIAVNRLGKYEDTEHTPDDLQMMIRSYNTMKIELTAYRDTGLTPEQIAEKLKALDNWKYEVKCNMEMIEAQQQEIEQFKAQVLAMREVLEALIKSLELYGSHYHLISPWSLMSQAKEAISINPPDYHNPADVAEIEQLKEHKENLEKHTVILRGSNDYFLGRVEALTADKDEQAGRIMRMEEGLKKAQKSISEFLFYIDTSKLYFDKFIGHTSFIKVGEVKEWRETNMTIKALLGGAEDESVIYRPRQS